LRQIRHEVGAILEVCIIDIEMNTSMIRKLTKPSPKYTGIQSTGANTVPRMAFALT
jgi:hypothetical protein